MVVGPKCLEKTWGSTEVAELVEQLPIMNEALGLIPSMTLTRYDDTYL